MGNSMGQSRVLFVESFGRSIQVTADGAPKWKAGGMTVDWTAIPACPAIGGTYYGQTVAAGPSGVGQVTFEDGVVVKTGEKALRYGTVMMYDSTIDTASVVDGDPNGAYRPALTGDTLARSQTFIVNETVTEDDTYSNHIGGMDGGRMWRARMVKSNTTVADNALVAGDQSEAAVATYDSVGGGVPPTLAQIEAVLPLVVWALDN